MTGIEALGGAAPASSAEAAVTRGEFLAAMKGIVDKIDGSETRTRAQIEAINNRGRLTASTVIGGIALLGGAIGFGVSNLTKVISLEEVARSNSESTKTLVNSTTTLQAAVATLTATVASHEGDLENFRGRLRASEAHIEGNRIENETQHKWMANAENLDRDRQDLLNSLFAQGIRFDLPPRGFFPLEHIGMAPAQD